VPVTPKTIVYLRPDTIGDLVLFTPALNLFLAEWPKSRHVIVVREGYESLAPLFPKALEWKVARLNPFKQRPAQCRKELSELIAALGAMDPDLIMAPTLNRTWLELAVAGHFKDIQSVVLGGAEVDPIFAASLRLDLGVDPAASFRETVSADTTLSDVDNQHLLAEHVIGRKLPSRFPSLGIPEDAAKKARAIAGAHGLASGEWAGVFVGGLANVAVKAWTAEGFAEVAAWLQAKKKIPALILAHADEASAADAVADRIASMGGSRPGVWLGKSGELPILAGLMEDSKLYVGNDTGAMHIAAAVGRPVVGIFGGGHWPRFRPAAKQAVSVVQPLPCFGCNWDCHFGDGPCVKTIPASDVIAGVEHILGAGDLALNDVVESRALGAGVLKLISASTPGILSLKRDMLDRQHKIEELKAETDSKDIEMTALKSAAEDRKNEMEAIKAELEEECADKDKEIEEKDVEIADLKRAAEDRKKEMEAIKAELEEECADKDKEIGELKAEADTKDVEITELKDVCNEREAVIIKLDGHIKHFQKASLETQAHVGNIEAEKERLAGILAKLPPDAEQWSTAFGHKDVHIGNIEGMLRSRDEEIVELKAAVANYAAGYGGLEQAKHYGKLLVEKEAVIRDLHRICLEREKVIESLAAGGTMDSSGLGRFWAAAKYRFRERLWNRLARWVSQKVVEEYWMQIGTFRQYEPRPIQWDRRIGKPRIPDDKLPKMGIVTPSYGQPKFLESTLLSVLNQNYPKLLYVVQDGGSQDSSPEIIARYASRLRHWQSAPDSGQADAIRKGFSHMEAELAPKDVMAWFNSDDLVAPRALRFVAAYFAGHPEVDVVYGHRIIIDEADREIGRWIMPHYDPASIEWIDYVPQETLFWRKRAWDLAGGIDPAYQFALDWDLLARFHAAGCRVVRLPYFLGCFRIHPEQKTSQAIHTTGVDEMSRIRNRFHGAKEDDLAEIERHARRTRIRGVLSARLLASGIRW